MPTKEKIIKSYVEFELLNGRAPHSVFELTKKLKMEEKEFYQNFSNLDKIKQGVLEQIVDNTLDALDRDGQYDEFSAREKMLALFFTTFEQMQTQRSYLLLKYKDMMDAPKSTADWKPFMTKFDKRINEILEEAKSTEEIKDRPLIGSQFSKGFGVVFIYVFRVWVNDESIEFANTDAAIEKAVNVSLDMLAASPLDSLIDFGKFVLKTKAF